MDQGGIPPPATIVREMANILLAERVGSESVTPPTVGKNWVYNYVKRHPELKSKYHRKYNHQERNAEIQNLFKSGSIE
jgi:hypothetical protein